MGGRSLSTWAIFNYLFLGHEQKAALEVEQPGLELEPIQDALTAGGSLTYYTNMLPL